MGKPLSVAGAVGAIILVLALLTVLYLSRVM